MSEARDYKNYMDLLKYVMSDGEEQQLTDDLLNKSSTLQNTTKENKKESLPCQPPKP